MLERVIGFHSEPREVLVSFSKSARIFRLALDQPNFATVMAKLVDAFKSNVEVIPVSSEDRLLDVDRCSTE